MPPVNFGVSEKHFLATIEKMEEGKMFESLLYGTEPLYIMHFQSIFEEFWKEGIDAKERIHQIERGIASETTKVVENPIQIRKLFLDLIESTKEEIMIIFSSFNSVKRQRNTGIIGSLKQKSQENIRIRILSPMSKNEKGNVKEMILLEHTGEKAQTAENIIVREIVREQDIKSTILMVDRKDILTIELKDDSKESFGDAIGLSTYSTSKPTVSSYISIFESLWSQTEMFENLRFANQKLVESEQNERFYKYCST